MSKEHTPDKKLSLAWDSGKPWIKYDHSLLLSVHYEGGNGITSKKAFELVDEIVNRYNSQEYASLQNAELQRENESLRKQLHEHNGICQEKLSEQLNSVLPEIKLLKEQNAELLEVIKDLGRFIPSLRFVVDNGLQSPENCLAVIDRIESLIEKYTDKN